MTSLSFPVLPMKASLGSVPIDDGAPDPDGEPGWAYEVKWDGHRTLAHLDGDEVRFQSSAGHDVTGRWSDVTGLAVAVNASSAILDGEMVVIGDDGRPSFDLVQKRSVDRDRPAIFQVFDVLQVDGTPATSLRYADRRRLLDELVEENDRVRVPPHRIGGGADLLAATAEQGLEGIVAKRVDSLYRPGTRSKDWLKVKHRTRVELTIGGWTTGSGRRASTFGALLVGIDPRTDDRVLRRIVEQVGSQAGVGGLRFAGGVGTGFDQATLESLTADLRSLASDACPFEPAPPSAVRRTANWVRPELSATVDIAEFTNDGLVRHSSFVELS